MPTIKIILNPASGLSSAGASIKTLGLKTPSRWHGAASARVLSGQSPVAARKGTGLRGFRLT
jgi:hypothetical protein